MSYCIMRIEKRRRAAVYGLQIEANRCQDDHEKRGRDFAASDIAWDLTPFNMYLVKADNWSKAITTALKSAKVEERKNSVVLLDGFYGASKEWFADKTLEEIVDYFKDCLAFHEREFGTVINAVIHFDESVPHLQIASIPLISAENNTRLSAKEIMGNRTDYRKRQDLFYEQVGKSRGLERGEVHDPEHIRKHLSVQQYKNEQLEFENQQRRKESKKLQNECKQLLLRNQQLEVVNQSLVEQTQEPFLHYCMMEFIRNAKVKGERGEIKLVIDGFQSYMARNIEQLRAKWEQQLLPNYYPPQENERFREHEYEQAPEYDDRER